MAWSIFDQGGGPGAAVTWAQDLLQAGGYPETLANEQFVYDWEESEGGGGVDNPVNQGPVPGQPQLTTTGEQYGGGAADYASIPAGIQGTLDYLNMPAYAGVKQGLERSDYQAAASALWASPWAASHYGNGSAWNTDALPGQASAITDGATGQTATLTANPLNPGGDILGALGVSSGSFTKDLIDFGVTVAGVTAGAALVVAGLYKAATGGKSVTAAAGRTAELAGTAAAL